MYEALQMPVWRGPMGMNQLKSSVLTLNDSGALLGFDAAALPC